MAVPHGSADRRAWPRALDPTAADRDLGYRPQVDLADDVRAYREHLGTTG